MDKEQEEVQYLGFFGIFKESFNIVPAWRSIFSQISLVLIFPLSFIYLAHIQISQYLFSNIVADEYILDRVPEGTPTYNSISDVLSSEWTTFLLFKIGYFVFFIVLTLLSTSAVVYTIACIYTAKDITFRKVMSVVPKVWKRLMSTFLWNFIIVFAYNLVAILVLAIFVLIIPQGVFLVLVVMIILMVYLAGFVYISVIWHLASVVSVLEERYGLNAMIKSHDLIKGKMGISTAMFVIFGLCFFGIQIGFQWFVVLGNGGGLFWRFGYGVLCLTLLSMLILFGLIIETIIYFICKSYHHENIDKSSLSDHLEVYLGEYVPLKSKDVQLEHFEV
ncbi:OLC1v1016386C1 [Oldenlandia corymbosa var. corymbosa]|uniref:OLC1v1016386C1 n=1 Tax=Oldenlandia corymbosa var. corymbosa TaxID=529605 RepID=A0AAV1E5K3_OLDCO|nr:OLC1v1016386C1 [Oldenlandia corymbosa var. corymbosa]